MNEMIFCMGGKSGPERSAYVINESCVSVYLRQRMVQRIKRIAKESEKAEKFQNPVLLRYLSDCHATLKRNYTNYNN